MRRAQHRSTQNQSGAQPTQPSTGNVSGSGENVSSTGGNVSGTGANTGATSTAVRDQPGGRTETTSTSYSRETAPEAGYATTGRPEETIERTALGGGMSMLAGLLTFLFGLAMVVRPLFYRVLPGYAYRFGTGGHDWGWTLLAVGIVLFAAGASHTLGLPFARAAAIGMAVLAIVAGFLALAYSPIWGFLVVALGAAALWALLHRRDRSRGYGSRSMRM
jgi:hypothetical protein